MGHHEMERELASAGRAEEGMTPGERKAALPLLAVTHIYIYIYIYMYIYIFIYIYI